MDTVYRSGWYWVAIVCAALPLGSISGGIGWPPWAGMLLGASAGMCVMSIIQLCRGAEHRTCVKCGEIGHKADMRVCAWGISWIHKQCPKIAIKQAVDDLRHAILHMAGDFTSEQVVVLERIADAVLVKECPECGEVTGKGE